MSIDQQVSKLSERVLYELKCGKADTLARLRFLAILAVANILLLMAFDVTIGFKLDDIRTNTSPACECVQGDKGI